MIHPNIGLRGCVILKKSQVIRVLRTVYTISIPEVLKEYERNKKFRDLILTENFVYINDSYVCNDPRYINFQKNGTLILTDYAKERPEDCSLAFDETTAYTVFKTSKRVGSGDVNVDVEREKTFSKKNEAWLKAAVKEAVRAGSSEKTFWDHLAEIFTRHNTNAEDFESRTLLDKRSTYYKYMNENKRPKKVEVPTIVAIAVGYDLTLHETEGLMRLIGLSFIPANREHSIYKFILTLRTWDIHERNQVLDIAKVKRLGSHSRDTRHGNH